MRLEACMTGLVLAIELIEYLGAILHKFIMQGQDAYWGFL